MTDKKKRRPQFTTWRELSMELVNVLGRMINIDTVAVGLIEESGEALTELLAVMEHYDKDRMWEWLIDHKQQLKELNDKTVRYFEED